MQIQSRNCVRHSTLHVNSCQYQVYFCFHIQKEKNNFCLPIITNLFFTLANYIFLSTV